jgi:hypothetical protein
MKEVLQRCKPGLSSLTAQLATIINEGLIYSEGCVLLKSQAKLTQPYDRQRFQDETGYECFVNHVHLDDILPFTDICDLLGQALVFADELATLKLTTGISEKLQYIVAGDQDEMNVRFHVIRPGQSWLVDDLETYTEAVATILLS